MLFSPGETIVRIGDISRSLRIVRRGKAEVLSADRSCVVATFGPGGYFGEVMMIMFISCKVLKESNLIYFVRISVLQDGFYFNKKYNEYAYI